MSIEKNATVKKEEEKERILNQVNNIFLIRNGKSVEFLFNDSKIMRQKQHMICCCLFGCNHKMMVLVQYK